MPAVYLLQEQFNGLPPVLTSALQRRIERRKPGGDSEDYKEEGSDKVRPNSAIK